MKKITWPFLAILLLFSSINVRAEDSNYYLIQLHFAVELDTVTDYKTGVVTELNGQPEEAVAQFYSSSMDGYDVTPYIYQLDYAVQLESSLNIARKNILPYGAEYEIHYQKDTFQGTDLMYKFATNEKINGVKYISSLQISATQDDDSWLHDTTMSGAYYLQSLINVRFIFQEIDTFLGSYGYRGGLTYKGSAVLESVSIEAIPLAPGENPPTGLPPRVIN